MSLNEYPQDRKALEDGGDPYNRDGRGETVCQLYETPGTMNSSWGFQYFDQNWITPEKIVSRREHRMGVNYLLNVGPDGLGRIPSFSVDALRQAETLYRKKHQD